MKNRRIVSLLFFISGLMFSGMVLFADALGLDDHSGWGRTRILALGAGIFVTASAALYVAYQARAESWIAELNLQVEKIPSASSLLKIWRSYSFLLPIVLFVILTYIWLISSGTWTEWTSPTRYYANLARGFENGNLFIPGAPDPKLNELSNPYDPAMRVGIDVPVDVSYYNGKYYLYWGPVPALMLVPLQAIFHGRVGDLQLTFFFTCGIFLFLCIMLVIIWDAYFRELPKWMLGVSILLMGTANPTLFMLNNFKGARIYEAAVTGGQFFLIGGLLFAILSLWKTSSRVSLIVAGILWALAVGTRFFLFLPIGALCIILFFHWLSKRNGWSWTIGNALSLGIPLLFGALAIGWYNWARFGSVTESGLYYQLAGHNLQQNYNLLIHPAYFFQNLYNYFIHPFGFDPQFPFVHVDYGKIQSIFPSFPLPAVYLSQQISGLLPSVPFVILALIPLVQLIRQRHSDGSEAQGFLFQVTLLTLGSFAVAALFLMFFFWSAMRYLEDFMPSLLLLSCLGFWQGYQSIKHNKRSRKIYSGLSFGLAAISTLLSLLIAISINDARFQILQFFNP